MATRWVRPPLLALSAALVLGGCSQGTGAPARDPGYDDPTALEALLREISLASEGQEAVMVDMVEERIAACMASEGFEYVPAPMASTSVVDPADAGALPGTLEFAEQYGYGITTDPWGFDEGSESVGTNDPNAAIIDAMSASEVEEYYAALYGSSTADEPYDWRTAGCAGAAQHEVYDTVEGLDSGEYVALREELVRVLSVASDPSLAPLVEDWAGCMSENGHPGFTEVEEPAAAIAQESASLPAEELEGLTQREIEVATADARCRAEVGYDVALREVQVERQEEFYDAHRTELETWRDAVQEQAAAAS